MQKSLSEYSGSASGANWSPSLQAMFDALEGTGGKAFIDEQKRKLQGGAQFLPDANYDVPLIIEGDGSSELSLEGGTGSNSINLARSVSVRIRDLVLSGNGSMATKDCSTAIVLGSNINSRLENVQFFGIHPNAEVVAFNPATKGQLDHCNFLGGAGLQVHVNGATSIEMSWCDFLDYGDLDGVHHSKTPIGAEWFRAENANLSGNGANSTSIKINNGRFDEGSIIGIKIEDYQSVEIDQCKFNVYSADGGCGIQLTNVENAVIRQCRMGYTSQDKPAIRLINCGKVTIIGLQVDGGVYRVEADETSRAGCRLINCADVVEISNI